MGFTVSTVVVAPQIDVNPDPSGPSDLLTGSAAGFYNSVLAAIGLNLTVLPHFEPGTCSDLMTGNCTGVRGDLQSGAADFSLIALPINDYDPRAAPYPVRIGPFLYDAILRFGGLPETMGGQSSTDLMYTLSQISPVMFGLTLCALVCTAGLINWSTNARKFRKRMQWWLVVCMMTMHSFPRSLFKPRRRISLYVCLLMAFFFYQVYQASTTTDRITSTPPHYLSTVLEVAESKRTPLLFKGHITYLTYKDHANPKFRSMVRRAKLYDASQTDTFDAIAKDVILRIRGISFGNDIVVQVIQCFICFNTEFTVLPVRFGKPFGHSYGYATYKKDIDPDLKDRLDNVYYRFAESGLYEKQNSDPIPKVSSIMNPEKLLMCLTGMNAKHEQDFKFEAVDLLAFEVILKALIIAFIPCALVCLVELAFTMVRKWINQR